MKISKLKMYLKRNQIKNKDLAFKMSINVNSIRSISEEGIKGIRTAKRYARVLYCDYTELLEEKNHANEQTEVLD